MPLTAKPSQRLAPPYPSAVLSTSPVSQPAMMPAAIAPGHPLVALARPNVALRGGGT